MSCSSVDRYNILVGLYERYATERREILQLFDEMKRSNQEALDGVSDIILKHNHHGLSKRFPKSMFGKIPSVNYPQKPLFM